MINDGQIKSFPNIFCFSLNHRKIGLNSIHLILNKLNVQNNDNEQK